MKKLLLLVCALVIAGAVYFYFNNQPVGAPESPDPTADESKDSSKTKAFNKTQYSLTDPGSLWLIVNKQRALSIDYIPKDLVKPDVPNDPSDSPDEQKVRQDIKQSVETMFAEAKKAGHSLLFASGYRSAKLQANYYNGYVARDGEAAANRYSAKPGTSEHQTGLAFDLARSDRKCYLEICFADTAEGKWLAANAYKYGFTLRYPKGKEDITGYQYEPWHFRYVGLELASELQKTNQTLEEFFEL